MKRIIQDYSLLLKIVELVLACVCMNILSVQEKDDIPQWLWTLYCIDSTTYVIIFFVLCLAHLFQKEKDIQEFTYLTVGIVLYWIAGISGIVRAYNVGENPDLMGKSEKTMGIVLIVCSGLMLLEVSVLIYLSRRRRINEVETQQVQNEVELTQ